MRDLRNRRCPTEKDSTSCAARGNGTAPTGDARCIAAGGCGLPHRTTGERNARRNDRHGQPGAVEHGCHSGTIAGETQQKFVPTPRAWPAAHDRVFLRSSHGACGRYGQQDLLAVVDDSWRHVDRHDRTWQYRHLRGNRNGISPTPCPAGSSSPRRAMSRRRAAAPRLQLRAASTVSLSGGTIAPNGGTCTVTAAVTSNTLGTYTNTIPAGGVTSSQGSNWLRASATLAVVMRPAGHWHCRVHTANWFWRLP